MLLNKQKSQAFTPEQQILYDNFKHLAERAARSNFRRYQSTGCLTLDDLIQEGYLGLIIAVRKKKALTHKNPGAYIYSFCSGYITHALHRKSRVVKPPYSALKAKVPCFHVSLEAISDTGEQNLEPQDQYPELLTTWLESLEDSEYDTFMKSGTIPKNKIRSFEELKQAICHQ